MRYVTRRCRSSGLGFTFEMGIFCTFIFFQSISQSFDLFDGAVAHLHQWDWWRCIASKIELTLEIESWILNLGGRRGGIQHAGTLFLHGRWQWTRQRADTQPWTGDEAWLAAAFRSRCCDVFRAVSRSSTLSTRPWRLQWMHVNIWWRSQFIFIYLFINYVNRTHNNIINT